MGSLSLGFIGIVIVSPPVMFSMIVELVALVIVELSLLLFEQYAIATFVANPRVSKKITAIKNVRTRTNSFTLLDIRHYQ